MSDRTYRMLMVCTGNICRSPVMERLFVARLSKQLDPAAASRFEVRSAGTWAMVGSPMSPEAAETLISLGGDAAGFVARDLDVKMINAADLIVTATREHRGLVVTAEPAAASRTLTLREFARLLGPVSAADIDRQASRDDPVERTTAIAAAAFANRGVVPTADAADDGIADPYRRNRAAYRRAANEIDAALAVPLALLFPIGQQRWSTGA